MQKIAAMLSLAGFALLACPLPGQCAELMPSPSVAGYSTEYAGRIHVRHGWARWPRLMYIEGYSPTAYAYEADAAANFNGLYPYPRYYAGHYDPYWYRYRGIYHDGWFSHR